MNGHDVTGTRVTAYLNELEKTFFLNGAEPGSYAYQERYYMRLATRERLAFRVYSVALIILGAVLPVVAAFGERLSASAGRKDVVIGIMAALMALLSGISSYFRFEVLWRGHVKAMVDLRRLRAEWEATVAHALIELNEGTAIGLLTEAYGRFRNGVYEAGSAEMQEFFRVTQPPASKVPDLRT